MMWIFYSALMHAFASHFNIVLLNQRTSCIRMRCFSKKLIRILCVLHEEKWTKDDCNGDLAISIEYFVPYTAYTVVVNAAFVHLFSRYSFNFEFTVYNMNVQCAASNCVWCVYVCAWCLFIFLYNFPVYLLFQREFFLWSDDGRLDAHCLYHYEGKAVMRRMVCGTMFVNVYVTYETAMRQSINKLWAIRKSRMHVYVRCKTFP